MSELNIQYGAEIQKPQEIDYKRSHEINKMIRALEDSLLGSTKTTREDRISFVKKEFRDKVEII